MWELKLATAVCRLQVTEASAQDILLHTTVLRAPELWLCDSSSLTLIIHMDQMLMKYDPARANKTTGKLYLV